MRRRSPAPPFPPDHRQAGERGAITVVVRYKQLDAKGQPTVDRMIDHVVLLFIWQSIQHHDCACVHVPGHERDGGLHLHRVCHCQELAKSRARFSCSRSWTASRACGERPPAPPSSSASSSAVELAPKAAAASGWRRSSSCSEMWRGVRDVYVWGAEGGEV